MVIAGCQVTTDHVAPTKEGYYVEASGRSLKIAHNKAVNAAEAQCQKHEKEFVVKREISNAEHSVHMEFYCQ